MQWQKHWLQNNIVKLELINPKHGQHGRNIVLGKKHHYAYTC
jgi:hypothetical protein